MNKLSLRRILLQAGLVLTVVIAVAALPQALSVLPLGWNSTLTG